VSIEGRIAVDALFHEKDGSAISVVTLQGSKAYASGKVAIVSGTASNSTPVSFFPQSGVPYRDASGELVTFSSVSVLAAFGQDINVEAIGIGPSFEYPDVFSSFYSGGDIVSVTQLQYVAEEIRVRATSSTQSSYTLVLYGV
jgi:hypothetical protein